MRCSIVLGGIASVALAGVPVLGSQIPATAAPQIVVTGTGRATVTPDRATIFIGVQTRGASASAAGSENARRQRGILDTLRRVGVGGGQISTMNYNVSPELQYSQTGQAPPKITGYVVSNTVRVELHAIDDVARVIDAALAKGANDISSLQLHSSKADSARRAALAAAVLDARADAESLAQAAGGSLGRLLELATAEPSARPVSVMMSPRMGAADKTPIEAGEQTVTAVVTVRWAFVVGR